MSFPPSPVPVGRRSGFVFFMKKKGGGGNPSKLSDDFFLLITKAKFLHIMGPHFGGYRSMLELNTRDGCSTCGYNKMILEW